MSEAQSNTELATSSTNNATISQSQSDSKPKNDLLSSNVTNKTTYKSASSASNTQPQLPLPPITHVRRKRKKQRLFTKDIENLLYAMGDRPVSTDLTVNALEDILVEYLVDLSVNIHKFAKSQGRTRIKMNDLGFTLRNDPLKLARFQYIIEQSYKIERAKKMFEDKTTNYTDEGTGLNEDGEYEEGEDEYDQPQQLRQQQRVTGETKEKNKKKRKVAGNVMHKKKKKDL